VLAAVETEDRAAIMDSMILCKFLRGVFVEPFAEWAGLARLLEEPLEIGSGRVARLTPERLRAMIDGYDEARGLDGAGRPEAAALDDLGLVN
jgi:aldehyde:ferredoxin oxidoreductase